MLHNIFSTNYQKTNINFGVFLGLTLLQVLIGLLRLSTSGFVTINSKSPFETKTNHLPFLQKKPELQSVRG